MNLLITNNISVISYLDNTPPRSKALTSTKNIAESTDVSVVSVILYLEVKH
jgi:hypothetical protein